MFDYKYALHRFLFFFLLSAQSYLWADQGTISGMVYDATNPQYSFQDLIIVCYDYYTENYVAMGRTQFDGSYRIDLPAGDYKVYAQPEKESAFIPEYFNDTFDSFYAQKVSVFSGQLVKNINFGLAIGGIISGSVLNYSDNSIIVFMRIEAYDMNGDLKGYTTSLDDGRYYLHVPEGLYKIRAYDTTDRNYVTVFYKGTFNFANAEIIEVKKGYGSSYYNFYILEGIKVEGIITGINQAPVQNVTVWALATTGRHQHWAQTLSDGTYEMIVPEGSYWFYSESSNYLSQYYQHAHEVVNATIVMVDRNISGIDFQLVTEIKKELTLKDVVVMLQVLSGFSNHQSGNEYDQNGNNLLDMMDVLQILTELIKN